jgi:adrenodoxin-NADP+ reductase
MQSLIVKRLLSSSVSKGRQHVAVVGSGPAGFYVSQQLLKQKSLDLNIDIYEKLPVPFGLVRYGVAPDHPDVKNVETTFTKVAHDDRVRFVGNVAVGQDVKVAELRQAYDAVVLSYGAGKDRILDIPGENSDNVLSARNFVGFYNGLPEDKDLTISLDCEEAVIVGLGNVAIDVARVLTTPVDQLRGTDITEAALDKLSKSRIKRVYLVGRRGPLQVAFTIKELREMLHIQGCQPCFDQNDFVGMSNDLIQNLKRPRKRLTELLFKAISEAPTQKQLDIRGANPEKEWHLKLLRSPLEIHSDHNNSVASMTLGINQLVGNEMTESQVVKAKGTSERIDCGLVLRSIGYQSVRVEDGIPYDEKKGIVPNVDGKVETGLYCSGWLATGPRGVIADTMNEAFKVGQTITNDLKELQEASAKKGFSVIADLFRQRNVRPVNFGDWEKIDAKEKALGETSGKPREKFTDVNDMISHLEKK